MPLSAPGTGGLPAATAPEASPREGQGAGAQRGQRTSEILRQKPMPKRGWEAGAFNFIPIQSCPGPELSLFLGLHTRLPFPSTFNILHHHAQVAPGLKGAEHADHKRVLSKSQYVTLHEGLLDLVPQNQVLLVDLLHGKALTGGLVPHQEYGPGKRSPSHAPGPLERELRSPPPRAGVPSLPPLPPYKCTKRRSTVPHQ